MCMLVLVDLAAYQLIFWLLRIMNSFEYLEAVINENSQAVSKQHPYPQPLLIQTIGAIKFENVALAIS